MLPHVIEKAKALTAVSSCLEYYETYLRLANKLISGLPQWSVIFMKSIWLSCHSAATSKIRDCSSDSLFLAPGIWAADVHNFLEIQNSRVFKAISLQDCNVIAVMLSHIILTCVYVLLSQYSPWPNEDFKHDKDF